MSSRSPAGGWTGRSAPPTPRSISPTSPPITTTTGGGGRGSRGNGGRRAERAGAGCTAACPPPPARRRPRSAGRPCWCRGKPTRAEGGASRGGSPEMPRRKRSSRWSVRNPSPHEPQLLVVVGVERHLGAGHELHAVQHDGEDPRSVCGRLLAGGSVIATFEP